MSRGLGMGDLFGYKGVLEGVMLVYWVFMSFFFMFIRVRLIIGCGYNFWLYYFCLVVVL